VAAHQPKPVLITYFIFKYCRCKEYVFLVFSIVEVFFLTPLISLRIGKKVYSASFTGNQQTKILTLFAKNTHYIVIGVCRNFFICIILLYFGDV